MLLLWLIYSPTLKNKKFKLNWSFKVGGDATNYTILFIAYFIQSLVYLLCHVVTGRRKQLEPLWLPVATNNVIIRPF